MALMHDTLLWFTNKLPAKLFGVKGSGAGTVRYADSPLVQHPMSPKNQSFHSFKGCENNGLSDSWDVG